MRIRHCLLPFLIVFAGCAGMKPERYVLEDNVFVSSASPKISVRVNPVFKYLGKADDNKYAEYKDTGIGGTIVSHESHLFGLVEGGKIRKGVLFRISKTLEGYMLPDLFEAVKNKLESGVTAVRGKNYQHVTCATARVFNEYEDRFILDNGYIISNCYLAKVLGRRIGPDHMTAFFILYFEDMHTIGCGRRLCRDWINKASLTDEQTGDLI